MGTLYCILILLYFFLSRQSESGLSSVSCTRFFFNAALFSVFVINIQIFTCYFSSCCISCFTYLYFNLLLLYWHSFRGGSISSLFSFTCDVSSCFISSCLLFNLLFFHLLYLLLYFTRYFYCDFICYLICCFTCDVSSCFLFASCLLFNWLFFLSFTVLY